MQPNIGSHNAADSDVALRLKAGLMIAAPDINAVTFSLVVSNRAEMKSQRSC